MREHGRRSSISLTPAEPLLTLAYPVRAYLHTGFIVAAGPGPNHLFGLKAVLYDNPVQYSPRPFGSSTVGGPVMLDGPEGPPPPAEQVIQVGSQVDKERASERRLRPPHV